MRELFVGKISHHVFRTKRRNNGNINIKFATAHFNKRSIVTCDRPFKNTENLRKTRTSMVKQGSPKTMDRRYFWRSTGPRDNISIQRRTANKLRRRVLYEDYDQNPQAESSQPSQAEEIPSSAAINISPIVDSSAPLDKAQSGGLSSPAAALSEINRGSQGMHR